MFLPKCSHGELASALLQAEERLLASEQARLEAERSRLKAELARQEAEQARARITQAFAEMSTDPDAMVQLLSLTCALPPAPRPRF